MVFLISLYVAVAALAVLLARYIVIVLKHPSAPGPRLAQWTTAWYGWKVWKGNFETWNMNAHAIHGKVVRIAPYMYSIDDPTAVKQLYGIRTPMIKSTWYSFAADPAIGPNHNLFSTQDPAYHSQARRRQAAFYSMSTIKSYEPFVDECIAVFKEQFGKLAKSGELFNLQVWSQSYAFDTISQITFGAREGFLDKGAKDTSVFESIWDSMTFTAVAGITFPWGMPLLLAYYGNPVQGLVNYVESLTAKAENNTSASPSEKPITTEKDLAHPETFFAKLLSDAKAHPIEHNRFRTFSALQANITAGSDTTSIAITTILYNAARSPEIWSRLRAELASAIKSGEISATEPITYAQSQNLPYLQAVIKEALRFHPSVGLPLWRVIPAGGAIVAGVQFPEGTWVGINAWVSNRNREVFGEDAGSFNPARYLPFPGESAEDTKHRLEKMEAYTLTFGAGSRVCAGKWVSLLEIGKLIPEIVRSYVLQVEGKKIEPDRTNCFFVKQVDAMARVEAMPLMG